VTLSGRARHVAPRARRAHRSDRGRDHAAPGIWLKRLTAHGLGGKRRSLRCRSSRCCPSRLSAGLQSDLPVALKSVPFSRYECHSCRSCPSNSSSPLLLLPRRQRIRRLRPSHPAGQNAARRHHTSVRSIKVYGSNWSPPGPRVHQGFHEISEVASPARPFRSPRWLR
jgi:hypothetical protein